MRIRNVIGRANVDGQYWICVDSQVTEEDANDVVQLLQESLLDAYTDELGQIDAGRRGGISLAKQVIDDILVCQLQISV